MQVLSVATTIRIKSNAKAFYSSFLLPLSRIVTKNILQINA